MSLSDLTGFDRCWSSVNLFASGFRSTSFGIYRFDPSNQRLSSSEMVAALVCWPYRVLARRIPDCLPQQGLSGSDERGAMTAPRLRLALVFVVVARWSTDLVVIFITSSVLCTVKI